MCGSSAAPGPPCSSAQTGWIMITGSWLVRDFSGQGFAQAHSTGPRGQGQGVHIPIGAERFATRENVPDERLRPTIGRRDGWF